MWRCTFESNTCKRQRLLLKLWSGMRPAKWHLSVLCLFLTRNNLWSDLMQNGVIGITHTYLFINLFSECTHGLNVLHLKPSKSLFLLINQTGKAGQNKGECHYHFYASECLAVDSQTQSNEAPRCLPLRQSETGALGQRLEWLKEQKKRSQTVNREWFHPPNFGPIPFYTLYNGYIT